MTCQTSYRVDIFTDPLPEGDARTMVVSYVRFARRRSATLDDDSFFHEFQELYDCILEDDPRALEQLPEFWSTC